MWPLTAVLVRNVPTSQRGVTDALVARLGTVAVSGYFRPCRPVGPQGRPPQARPAGDSRSWGGAGNTGGRRGAAGQAGIRPRPPVAARAEAGARQN